MELAMIYLLGVTFNHFYYEEFLMAEQKEPRISALLSILWPVAAMALVAILVYETVTGKTIEDDHEEL